uniref:Putative secreted protein n=1 Tax=Ixodes ricinus TaxID=34613 RepID=V5HBA9_IXORI
MFKLRFFILFLLAGLYFAESSPVESDSGKGEGVQTLEGKGETSPIGNGASGSEKKEESTGATKKLTHLISDQAVSETNGEKKEPEGGSSKEEEGAERKNRTLGSDLPDYIGTLDERRHYMVTLLGACGGQSQEYKINEGEIFFHNCTYTLCEKESRT